MQNLKNQNIQSIKGAMGCFGSESNNQKPSLDRLGQRTIKEISANAIDMLISKSLFMNHNYKEKIVKTILQKISQKSKLSIKNAILVFNASQHRFLNQQFRQVCHQAQNTILIACTSQDNYFGGFTPCEWKRDEMFTYQQDASSISFLFKVKGDSVQFYDLKPHQNKFSILNDDVSGPIFGQGHDINIVDQSDKNQSWNNLGKSYECQFKYGSLKSIKELNGEQKYKLKDYQIWKIQFA